MTAKMARDACNRPGLATVPGCGRIGLVAAVLGVMLPSVSACDEAFVPARIDRPAQIAPHADYVLLDERTESRFVVQRWIRRGSPPPSPAGHCDCVTVVLDASGVRLDLGDDGGITTVWTLPDVTGDALEELVVHDYTGGAHCCNFTRIFSFEIGQPRPLLSLGTGHPGIRCRNGWLRTGDPPFREPGDRAPRARAAC